MGSPASISVVHAISIDVIIATVAAAVGIGQLYRHNPGGRYVCDAATVIVTPMSLTVVRWPREYLTHKQHATRAAPAMLAHRLTSHLHNMFS